jgi:hypothetical protein
MWWQTLGGKLGNEHFDFHHLQPAREHLQYWLQRKTFNHEGVLVSARRLLGRDLIEFGNGVDTQLPPTPYIPHRGEYTFIPTQAQVDECSLFDWGEPPVIDLAVMRYAERLTGSERYALLSPREYALWSLYKKLPAYALVNSRKLIWGEDYDEHASAIVRKCY